ncbi:MAG: DUF3348 family protein [Rhodoferax sp.]|nr:DUF3348 family protein [Rhodoferax sp.]
MTRARPRPLAAAAPPLQPATHAHFHSTRLLQLLAAGPAMPAPQPQAAFAEHLGQWVDVASAFTLRALHNSRPLPHAHHRPHRPDESAESTSARQALQQQVARVQARLTAAITLAVANVPQAKPEPVKFQGDAAAQDPGQTTPPSENEPSFAPYLKLYQTQQRAMQDQLLPLRANVRVALASACAELKPLARLDQAFEAILTERETRLLAQLPSLLEKRFQAAQQAAAEAAPGAHPDWQLAFGQELQTFLLAELDLRLQPTLGLLDAWPD